MTITRIHMANKTIGAFDGIQHEIKKIFVHNKI